jgi:hypothetical protein
MRIALVLALAACESRHDAPVVGNPPAECEPPSDPTEDFTGPVLTTIAHVPVIALDPDCAAATTIVETTDSLAWRHGPNETVSSSMSATVRTSQVRVDDTCRVTITVTYRGGFTGQLGTLQACDRVLTGETWASFADVAVALEGLSIDDTAVAPGPVEWAEAPGSGPCTLIADGPLALAIIAQLGLPIADWQRLHGSAGVALGMRLAIDVW